MHFLDSSAKLRTAIQVGDWDVCLELLSGLSIPENVLVDLYEHVCIEFLERGETEVAEALLFATGPLSYLQFGDPLAALRFRRLETGLTDCSVLLADPYRGVTRNARRDQLAEELMSQVECIPSGRLVTLLGDAMRFQAQTREPSINREKFDVLRGAFHSDTTMTFVSAIVAQISIPAGSIPEAIVFHPRGSYLVVGSSDGLIEVYSDVNWNLALDLTYQNRGEFLIHDACVTALSFDSTGSMLVSGDKTGQVCLWDFKSGKRLKQFQSSPRGAVTCLKLDSGSSRIYVSSDDACVRIHGIKSGAVLKEFTFVDSISSHGRFSRSDFYTGGSDGILRIYSCESCTLQKEIVFPGSGAHVIRSVNIMYRSENQESIIVTYDAAPVVIFDGQSGMVLREYSIPDTSTGDSFVNSISSAHSEYLYCISTNGKLYCFDHTSGKLLNVTSVFKGEAISALHHPTRAIVLVVSFDGTVYVIGK